VPVDAHPKAWLRSATFVSTLVGALAAAAVAQAIEATRFEVDFYEPGKDQPVNHATVWLGKGMVRIDQQPHGDSQRGPTLIYRGEEGLVVTVSDRTESYVEIDRATITRLETQARRLRHEFATQLAALPPGQREQFERMLGISGTDPRQNTEPLLVLPGKGRSEVAGFSCRNVILEHSDRPFGRGCVTEWSRVGIQEKDLEIFRTLANLQRDALAARGFTPLELVPDQPFDLMTQLGGMPLLFERQSPRTGQISAIRVSAVSHERNVAGLFDPPKGYVRHTGGAAMLQQLAESGSPPASSSTKSTPSTDAEPTPASPAAPR